MDSSYFIVCVCVCVCFAVINDVVVPRDFPKECILTTAINSSYLRSFKKKKIRCLRTHTPPIYRIPNLVVFCKISLGNFYLHAVLKTTAHQYLAIQNLGNEVFAFLL